MGTLNAICNDDPVIKTTQLFVFKVWLHLSIIRSVYPAFYRVAKPTKFDFPMMIHFSHAICIPSIDFGIDGYFRLSHHDIWRLCLNSLKISHTDAKNKSVLSSTTTSSCSSCSSSSRSSSSNSSCNNNDSSSTLHYQVTNEIIQA